MKDYVVKIFNVVLEIHEYEVKANNRNDAIAKVFASYTDPNYGICTDIRKIEVLEGSF